MSLEFTATLDLSVERKSEEWEIRYLLDLPAGTRVVIDLGGREWTYPWSIEQLRRAVEHLTVQIRCDASVLPRWHAVLTGLPEPASGVIDPWRT